MYKYPLYPAPKAQQIHRSIIPLPQELIDNVISEARDDRATLRALSLISKACKDQCRKYLFSELVFETAESEQIKAGGDREQRFMEFAAILNNDPKIAAHAGTVFVLDSHWDTPHHSHHSRSWVITNSTFHKTLERLAENGTMLRFMFDGLYHWDVLPDGLAQALLAVFNGPCLKHLRLVHLKQLPMSACSAAVGIKMNELSLIDVSIARDYDHRLHIPPAPENLEILRLEFVDAGSISAFLDAILPKSRAGAHEMFPVLEALYVGPKTQGEVLALAEVVKAGSRTIKFFTWEYKYGVDMAEPLDSRPIDFGPVENLFSITYEVTTPKTQEIDPFTGLLSLLGTVNPINNIEDVRISVWIPNMTLALAHLMYYDGWQRLDTLLASNKFKKVSVLGFQLHLENVRTAEEERQPRRSIGYDAQLAMESREELGMLLQDRLSKWVATRRRFGFLLCVNGTIVK